MIYYYSIRTYAENRIFHCVFMLKNRRGAQYALRWPEVKSNFLLILRQNDQKYG
jgi:hypothetical protein